MTQFENGRLNVVILRTEQNTLHKRYQFYIYSMILMIAFGIHKQQFFSVSATLPFNIGFY